MYESCEYFDVHRIITCGKRTEAAVARAMEILDTATPETPRRKPDPNFFEATVKKAS